MKGDWYYSDDLAERQGPVDAGTLLGLSRSGVVLARSLVWQEGMPAWTPFRNVARQLYREHSEEGEAAEIGVCAHSGQVFPLREMLPYGAALVGAEHKADFVNRLMEEAKVGLDDATERRLDYVGFWWRTLSSLLDYLVKLVPASLCMVPYYIFDALDGVQAGGDVDDFLGAMGMNLATLLAYGFGLLASLGLSIGYETWMVGKYQATLGKMVIGAKVVNPDGSPLSYKKAFLRWLVKKPLNQLLVWAPATLGAALTVGFVVGFLTSMETEMGAEQGATILMAMFAGFAIFGTLMALGTGVYWMAAFDPEKRTLHDRITATRVVRKGIHA